MPAWMVRGQGLSCLRPDFLLMPAQMGQRIHEVPEGPQLPSRRQHLRVSRSLHPVLCKSARLQSALVSELCWSLGLPRQSGAGTTPLRQEGGKRETLHDF